MGWVGQFLAQDFAHEVPERRRLAGFEPGRCVTVDECIESLAKVANIGAEPGNEGLTACMRKLLVFCYALCQRQTTWDPTVT